MTKKSTPSGIPHGLNFGQKCLYYAKEHLIGVVVGLAAIVLILVLVFANPFDIRGWVSWGWIFFAYAIGFGISVRLQGKDNTIKYSLKHWKGLLFFLVVALLGTNGAIYLFGKAKAYDPKDDVPVYISCDKELGKFKTVLPCDKGNKGVRAKFLSAAQTAGAKVDAISPFDSKAQESGEPYTHVIFEITKEKKVIVVPPPPKKEEEGKKKKKKGDKEEDAGKVVAPPTTKTVTTTKLTVIFITNVPKEDDEKKDDAGKPNEKKSWRVTVGKRNIATYLVSSPDQINFMFFTVGFYRSRGKTLSTEELENIFGKQIPSKPPASQTPKTPPTEDAGAD